ncbi:MAG: autotransporter domain-containing protein [Pseudomonadota bacterium]
MKMKLLSASVLAVLAAWAPHGVAREAVALPGVVGAEGVLNGVDTTGNATLTVANDQNINTNNDLGGAFTTANNNQGNILFLGNSTVTGFTGATGNRFLNISAGVAGTTVDFNGEVFSTTITVSGTGTLNFNGDVTGAPVFADDGFISLGAGRMLTGAITTNTANTGTLTLNNGSSVSGAIGGANGLRQINVVGGNAAVTGAVQAQGFNLNENTLVITGALTTNAGGVIRTTMLSDAVFGKITVDTSNINAGGVTVIPTVTGTLTNGTTYKIVDAPAGTVGAVVSVINNNPRYTFAGLPTVTGDVNIRLTGVAPLDTLVTAPGAVVIGPILDVNAPANSDLLTVQDAIAVLPTTAAINNALVQLAPGATNLAAPRVAGQTAQLFDDLWMARLNEMQDLCDPQRNPAAPANAPQCKGFERQGNWWAKGFGNTGRQRDVNEQSGYKTETYGLMLAYDIPLSTDTRIGLGGGYANAKIDDNNSSGQTKLDSYHLTGYVNHSPGPWFVRGAVSVGTDRYDGSRSIVFPGVTRVASADYKGHHYSAIISAGQHYFFSGTTITPLASLQASRIHVGSYSETGAGDINLRVDSQDYDILQSGLGVKAERRIEVGNGNVYPEVHFKWLHDFASTTTEQTAAFTGGGGRFKLEGIDQDRDLFNVGAGVAFASCNCVDNAWTVKGLYDYKWNQSKFSSHQVAIVASYVF